MEESTVEDSQDISTLEKSDLNESINEPTTTDLSNLPGDEAIEDSKQEEDEAEEEPITDLGASLNETVDIVNEGNSATAELSQQEPLADDSGAIDAPPPADDSGDVDAPPPADDSGDADAPPPADDSGDVDAPPPADDSGDVDAPTPAEDSGDVDAPPPADESGVIDAPYEDESGVIESAPGLPREGPTVSEPGQNDDQIPHAALEEAQAAMSEQQFESTELPMTYTATSGTLVKSDFKEAGNARGLAKSNNSSITDYKGGLSPSRASQASYATGSASLSPGKLTFTGPPSNHRARPHVRSDFSHNTFETMKITNDNIKLCNRLVEISKAPPPPPTTGRLAETVCRAVAPANVAAAAINRSKAQDAIAQENLRMFKRLQAVKPSKDIARDSLAKDYKAAKSYGENARKFRDGSTF